MIGRRIARPRSWVVRDRRQLAGDDRGDLRSAFQQRAADEDVVDQLAASAVDAA